jgi:hypothetical protein
MLTKIVYLFEMHPDIMHVIKHVFSRLNYVKNTITNYYYCCLYNKSFNRGISKPCNMKQLILSFELERVCDEIQYVVRKKGVKCDIIYDK